MSCSPLGGPGPLEIGPKSGLMSSQYSDRQDSVDGSGSGSSDSDDDEDEDHGIVRDENNERTPLLGTNGQAIERSEIEEDNELGLWAVQYLLSVPFPVILVTQMALMLLNSLNQTLADGSSPANSKCAFIVYRS